MPWADVKARLVAASLGISLSWPNERFVMPTGALWAAVEMTSRNYRAIELGNVGGWQEEGSAYVHIMTPDGWGTDAARALAKTIADTFRGVPVGPIMYTGGSIGDGAAEDADGAWWRLTVEIEYRYQDTGV